jgi:hypothetical protein
MIISISRALSHRLKSVQYARWGKGVVQQMDRKKIEKMLAVAISPGAYEEEAIAALRKAREVVKQNPSLAHPIPPPPAPLLSVPPPDHSVEYRATNILPSWLNVLVGSLSQEAYGLGLRSKFSFDFSVTPTAVDIRCDGPKIACDAFEVHLHWLADFINLQPPET